MKFPEDIVTGKHNKAVNEDTLRQLLMLKPKKIVDVGSGDGFYGKLVKYCLPKAFILAVEKRTDYILNWKLNKIYDEVLNVDIVDIIDKISGDLIIFGDILEHLEKDVSTSILKKVSIKFKNIIINSPVGFQPQKHKFGEEIHRCGLDYTDFKNYDVIEYHTYCNNTMFNCLIAGKLNK